jgi:YggT family protein
VQEPPDTDLTIEEVVESAQTPEVPAAVAGGGQTSSSGRSVRRYADGTGPFRRSRATLIRRVPNYNYRAVRIVRYIAAVLEVLLVIRFFLKLLGASTDAAFTILVYGLTELFVLPFYGIFGHPASGAHMFESSSFVAILIYPLLALAITSLIRIRTARQHPVEQALEESDVPASSSDLYG